MHTTYCDGIRSAFEYLLENYDDCFVLGQGVWSPWYVGKTMLGLEKKFGKDRVIDTPVSEAATTGSAVGAAIMGLKPIVVHPRMDFMLYAMDPIVNQAAKWNFMFGGQKTAGLTVRAIVNRGGEQGAQHSQALHSWFAHIPGLRVVAPYGAQDARDLLIASVLSNDPVIFVDDRWLYDTSEEVDELSNTIIPNLNEVLPRKICTGDDITIVGYGYTTKLSVHAANSLEQESIGADVFDLRILNPMNCDEIIESVKNTGRLVVIDSGWPSCGIASEVITKVMGDIPLKCLKSNPRRIALLNTPAPTSSVHEATYYPDNNKVLREIRKVLVHE